MHINQIFLNAKAQRNCSDRAFSGNYCKSLRFSPRYQLSGSLLGAGAGSGAIFVENSFFIPG